MPIPKTLQVGLYMLMFTIGMIASSMGPLLIPIGESLSLSLGQIGILVTISTVGFLMGSTAVSVIWTLARVRNLICLATLFLCAILLAITFFHNNFAVLLVLFMARGIGQGLIHPAVNSLLADASGEQRMRALCISVAVFGLGAFIAPVLVGLILGWGQGWYYLYLIIAVFLFLPLALTYNKELYPKNHGSTRLEQKNASSKSMPLRSTVFWLIIAGNLLLLGMQISFASWMPTFLVAVRGLTPVSASYFIAIFWLTMMVGRIVYSFGLHRMDLSRALFLGALGASIFALMGLVVGTWLVLVMTACAGLSLSFVAPAWLALGGSLFPKHIGLVISLVTASSSVGGIIAISTVGFTSELFGLAHSILIVPTIGFAGFSVAAYLRYHYLRHQPTGS